MNDCFKSIVRDFVPPIAWRTARRLLSYNHASNEPPAIDRFYTQFVCPGDLVFDIGANLGNRTESFLRLGCKVVAVEPQTSCCDELRRRFGGDPNFALLQKAVGRFPGKSRMLIASVSSLSSLSPDFVTAVRQSGRFPDTEWTPGEEVEIVTFDELISAYGVPDYAKIDVEGFELEIIGGLSHQVPLVSLEWSAETTSNITQCMERLEELGLRWFNLTWGESMRMSRSAWLNREEMSQLLEFFREDSYLWADIFARRISP